MGGLSHVFAVAAEHGASVLAPHASRLASESDEMIATRIRAEEWTRRSLGESATRHPDLRHLGAPGAPCCPVVVVPPEAKGPHLGDAPAAATATSSAAFSS